MPLNNDNNNQQLYDKMLTDINQEIADMEEAERQMAAQGFSLADYSLQMATGTVRKQRIAQEQTLPPEEGFDRFKSIAPPDLYEGGTPEKQQTRQQPATQPKQMQTQYDLPAHLQGSYAANEMPIQKNQKDKEGNVYNERLVKIPRQFEGKEVYLLKDDEALKKQPWAKSAEVNGETVWYTEEANLPGAAYKRDILKEYQDTEKGSEIIYAGEGFGTLPKGSQEKLEL